MILVTVGTHDQPFDRLVRAADEMARTLDEQVIIQRGVATYVPASAESFPFTTSREMIELVRSARVVISHAAAGAIILALQERKSLILVARRQQWNEHRDDHQTQLARALHDSQRAIAVDHPTAESLLAAVETAEAEVRDPGRRLELCAAVENQLSRWQTESKSGFGIRLINRLGRLARR